MKSDEEKIFEKLMGITQTPSILDDPVAWTANMNDQYNNESNIKKKQAIKQEALNVINSANDNGYIKQVLAEALLEVISKTWK